MTEDAARIKDTQHKLINYKTSW